MASVDLWHNGIEGDAATARAAGQPTLVQAPAPNPAQGGHYAVPPMPRTSQPPPAMGAANGITPYSPTDWGGGIPAQQQRQMTDVMNGGGRPMQGYVQNKVTNDTLGTSHKYVGGRILAAGGGLGDVLHDPMFAGWTQVGPDKIKGPGGSVYDVRNANGAVQWTAISGPAWDRNGIAGVNSLGVNSSLAKNGIKGDYQAANAAAASANHAAGKSTFGYATSVPGGLPPAVGHQTSSYPGSGGGPGDPGSIQSSYTAQFSDPSTHQFENYLTTQMQALEAQRAKQVNANTGLQGQMNQSGDSAKALVDYLTQRAGDLQKPAYTGTEQEILRTQALDPIERDRTAANQRALNNIGSRGFDPTSGIAQQLIGDVNQGYDQQRAAAQGDLAYKQINEQRSRAQEAQSLLAMIPQVQSGNAQQQLQFMQALDAAINKPREQGMALSQSLYRLPAQAQNDALAAMGMGPTGDQLFGQAMSMYQAQNQQQQQGAGYYQMLGQLLPYLLGGN